MLTDLKSWKIVVVRVTAVLLYCVTNTETVSSVKLNDEVHHKAIERGPKRATT